MVYNNVNGFPVIAADQRSPYISWIHHRQRGSLGGVDMVANYGTKVRAPSSGRVTLYANHGSGGRILHIHAADGHADELLHLSEFLVSNGAYVTRGQIVGRSGASGFGKDRYYAPHLHWHRITASGVRVNPWDYFTKPSPSNKPTPEKKPPGIVYTARTGKPNKTFWARLQWYAHLNGYKGAFDGVMGIMSWEGVQRGLKNYGYKGRIDGEPGELTYKALQQMAKNYGYKGPIDGDMGPQSWIGVAKRLNKL